MFKLEKRAEKPDEAMNDTALGQRLWDELVQIRTDIGVNTGVPNDLVVTS